ncbi:MAG: hypothetical protein AB8U93_06355 [Francisella endosymbiont of Hyalomma scupense]
MIVLNIKAFINDWNNDIQAFSFDAIKYKTTIATLTYYRNNDKFFSNTQKLYIFHLQRLKSKYVKLRMLFQMVAQ